MLTPELAAQQAEAIRSSSIAYKQYQGFLLMYQAALESGDNIDIERQRTNILISQEIILDSMAIVAYIVRLNKLGDAGEHILP